MWIVDGEVRPSSVCCWWQAAIGAGASLLGSAASANSAKEQQETSQEMAREQMAFQERMSNSAHQREVTDLRAAGLNPILSSKFGGASSPSGAMGTAVDIAGPAIRSGISSAMSSIRMDQELANMEAEERKTRADEELQKQLKFESEGREKLYFQQVHNVHQDTENKKIDNEILQNNAKSTAGDAARGEVDEEMFKTPWGRVVRKIGAIGRELNPFASSVNSARSAVRR